MAPVGSPRRALTNLPVNTSPLPPIMASSREDAGHLKRRIFRVDDPETPPASIRPRAYQLAQKDAMIIRKSETSSEDVEEIHSYNASVDDCCDEVDRSDYASDGEFHDNSTKSVSTLMNLEVGNETTASQETAQTEVTQSIPSLSNLHVETLRLRLRVALFKVQTNQTNIPMSQVEIPPTDAHKQSQTISTSFSPQNKDAPLMLLPAPILFPTLYSARVIAQGQALSSPPRSKENSPMAVKYGNRFETPDVPIFKRNGSIIQTSSPPDSLSRGSVSTKKSETLTSSAIRGNAANLLLDLKHMD